jgi:hypothetical protein
MAARSFMRRLRLLGVEWLEERSLLATTAFQWDPHGAAQAVANSAPLLDTLKSPLLAVESEDAGLPIGAAGTPVSQLVDFVIPTGQVDNVTDVDAGAKLGIAVTGADTSHGDWFYTVDNGSTWLPLGNVGNTGARLLTADSGSRLYFKPATNYNGNLPGAITFRAWDQTSGPNGGFVTTAINGGGSAFSTAVDTASLTILAINDSPVLNGAKSPTLQTIVQNTRHPVNGTPGGTRVDLLVNSTSPAGGLDNVTDVDAGAQLGIAIIAADSGHGFWSFSIDQGQSWHPLGTPSDASARLLAADAMLYFTPTVGYSGRIATAITFRAWDRTEGYNGSSLGPATNGGAAAFSTSIDTAALLINDAPVLDTAKSPRMNPVAKNAGNPVGAVGTLTSQLVDFKTPAGQVDNVSDVNASTLLGIAVTLVDTTHGSWFYSTNDGSTWQLFTASTTHARLLAVNGQTRLYFRPNVGFTGTLASALTFRAWDRTVGANGGTADVMVSGGTTAFSRLGDTASITVA